MTLYKKNIKYINYVILFFILILIIFYLCKKCKKNYNIKEGFSSNIKVGNLLFDGVPTEDGLIKLPGQFKITGIHITKPTEIDNPALFNLNRYKLFISSTESELKLNNFTEIKDSRENPILIIDTDYLSSKNMYENNNNPKYVGSILKILTENNKFVPIFTNDETNINIKIYGLKPFAESISFYQTPTFIQETFNENTLKLDENLKVYMIEVSKDNTIPLTLKAINTFISKYNASSLIDTIKSQINNLNLSGDIKMTGFSLGQNDFTINTENIEEDNIFNIKYKNNRDNLNQYSIEGPINLAYKLSNNDNRIFFSEPIIANEFDILQQIKITKNNLSTIFNDIVQKIKDYITITVPTTTQAPTTTQKADSDKFTDSDNQNLITRTETDKIIDDMKPTIYKDFLVVYNNILNTDKLDNGEVTIPTGTNNPQQVGIAQSETEFKLESYKIYGLKPSREEEMKFDLVHINKKSKELMIGKDKCPSMSTMINNQVQIQQICESLEYRDKIKNNKITYERDKEYLKKLEKQDTEIRDLESVIDNLIQKKKDRLNKANNTDMLALEQEFNNAEKLRKEANEYLSTKGKIDSVDFKLNLQPNINIEEVIKNN